MDEKINAVRDALAALNRALSGISSAGIEADISTVEVGRINDQAACKVVAVHLTKLKTEIDVHL